MTTYLEYHETPDGINIIGIKEDTYTPIILQKEELRKVIDYLIGTEEIIVFSRPLYILKQTLPELETIIKDYEVRERWTDIQILIRNACGKNTTISKINEAMWGKEEKLTRLQPSFGEYDNFMLNQKITETLDSLQRIWETIQNDGRIGFAKKNEIIWVDLNANIYSRDDSI